MKTYNVRLQRGSMVCSEVVTASPIGLILYRWKMSKMWKVTVDNLKL